MSLFINYYATCGLVLAIFLLFLKYCRDTLKAYEGYPILHIIPYVTYCQIFRKIPKGMTLASFAFKTITDKCMQHMKEGFCMTYVTGPTLLVFNEEPVKIFLSHKSATDKPDVLYRILADGLGSGIGTNNGEKWRKHRKMLNPAFSLGMLKDNVPIFNKHALAFVEDLEVLVGKPSDNLLDYLKSNFFNVLNETIFGLIQTEENRAENLKYFRSIDRLSTTTIYRFGHPWLQWKFMLHTFSNGRKMLRIYEEVFNFSKKAVLLIKQQATSNPDCLSKSQLKSFTYALLQHHLNDPSFTFEDMHGEVKTFMAAGYDTVSYTAMWCLFMLGVYPEVQQKAYNEVQSVSEKDYISYEDCSNFTYLEAVILETLRLYPTLPLFARQISEDIQCGERIIPKDTVIGFFPYVLHRNPDIFPDPENFNPDRFLGSKKFNSWQFMPFSEGPRICIGKKYALLELKIFLAYFLRKFQITSLDKKEDIGLCWTVVLSPQKPLRMHIELR